MDSLSSGEACEQNSPLGLVFVGPFARNLMQGTIPSCVWAMPRLQILHLSGNGLQGSLGAISSASQLVDLDVSNNFLTGSIPTSMQVHKDFRQLLLGKNKLSGTLLESFATTDFRNLTLSVNRLSGDIPASFFSNNLTLNVLSGNLLSCVDGKRPPDDPSSHSYVCGSDNFNDSLYTWLTAVVTAIAAGVVIVILERARYVSIDFTAKGLRWLRRYAEIVSRLKHCGLLLDTAERIRVLLFTFGIIFVAICMPVYWILKAVAKDGIFAHEYTWVTTAGFLHGSAPTVLAALWVSISVLATTVMTQHMVAEVGEPAVVDDENSWMARVASVEWQRILQRIGMQLFSLAVVLLVNFLYIHYVLFGKVSPVSLALVQLALGCFKLFWKSVYMEVMVAWLRRTHTDLSDSGLVYHHVAMNVVNIILGPCIATLGTDSRCFYDAIVGDSAVTSSYTIITHSYLCDTAYLCDRFVPQCTDYTLCAPVPQIDHTTTSITPPWLYSYQCASAILTDYVPVLLLMFTMSGVAVPLLQYVYWLIPDSYFERLPASIRNICCKPVVSPKIRNPDGSIQRPSEVSSEARKSILPPQIVFGNDTPVPVGTDSNVSSVDVEDPEIVIRQQDQQQQAQGQQEQGQGQQDQAQGQQE